MTPILQVSGLKAGDRAGLVLHGIDFTVQPQEAVGLMGRNGMGKTTLIRTMLGLIKPRAGQILVDGRDVGALAPFQRAKLGIAVVPEGRGVFASLTVPVTTNATSVLAGETLGRLYASARLHGNLFQPSFKLKEKRREGARVIKRYHAPEPPVMRALTHVAVSEVDKSRLRKTLAEADPVLLLAGIRASQTELGKRVDERG